MASMPRTVPMGTVDDVINALRDASLLDPGTTNKEKIAAVIAFQTNLDKILGLNNRAAIEEWNANQYAGAIGIELANARIPSLVGPLAVSNDPTSKALIDDIAKRLASITTKYNTAVRVTNDVIGYGNDTSRNTQLGYILERLEYTLGALTGINEKPQVPIPKKTKGGGDGTDKSAEEKILFILRKHTYITPKESDFALTSVQGYALRFVQSMSPPDLDKLYAVAVGNVPNGYAFSIPEVSKYEKILAIMPKIKLPVGVYHDEAFDAAKAVLESKTPEYLDKVYRDTRALGPASYENKEILDLSVYTKPTSSSPQAPPPSPPSPTLPLTPLVSSLIPNKQPPPLPTNPPVGKLVSVPAVGNLVSFAPSSTQPPPQLTMAKTPAPKTPASSVDPFATPTIDEWQRSIINA